MKRNRLACLAAASLLAASSIGLAATPAAADTSRAGCTLSKPRSPDPDGVDANNRVMLKWVIDVRCDKGRSIQVHQQRWEQDDDSGKERGDDYDGHSFFNRSFVQSGGTHRFTIRTLMPQTKSAAGKTEPTEEMYQKVRFRVTSNGVTSEWTKFERSRIRWIFH